MNYKFRGKRTYINQWVYGSCYTAKNGEKYILEDDYLIEDGHHLRCNSDMPVFIRQETVGQWTGQKDKKGNDGFCGDLVKNKHGTIYQIVFNKELASFCLRYSVGKSCCFNSFDRLNTLSEYDIIGNIYDNPELLGDKK